MTFLHEGKRTSYRALHIKVLAVAREGFNKDWACYIKDVQGNSHEKEWYNAYKHGTKQSKELALFLFPDFKDLKYRY